MVRFGIEAVFGWTVSPIFVASELALGEARLALSSHVGVFLCVFDALVFVVRVDGVVVFY